MAKKRYWLKVKENFFDDDEIVFLKSQDNGYEYIYLWMRLLLKCLRSNEENECGFLRINDKVPYDVNMLSNLFGMNVDSVRVGIELFKKMGMLEILEDGTYYIEAIQKMIGKEGESAERMRLHREKRKLIELSQSDEEVTKKCDNIIKEEKEKEENKEIEKESFEKFWKLYNYKKNRKDCIKKWNKIKLELHDTIYEHVKEYVKSTPDKQFRKHPLTYLNGECWDDEVIFNDKQQPSQPKQKYKEGTGFYNV